MTTEINRRKHSTWILEVGTSAAVIMTEEVTGTAAAAERRARELIEGLHGRYTWTIGIYWESRENRAYQLLTKKPDPNAESTNVIQVDGHDVTIY